MLLYMQDYEIFLVVLGTMHFNNLLVKQRFPSQRSRFDSKSGKQLCMEKTLLMFGYRVDEKVSAGCG